MRVFKYLFGIWAAIAVYTLFSFFGGAKGLSAYNYLLAERDHQLENIRDLALLNEELEKARNNLLYDYDTLLVHARQMGYGQKDERFVRIVGLVTNKNNAEVPGNVYFAQNPDYISDKSIKIAAFCIGLLVFAFFFTLELIETRLK